MDITWLGHSCFRLKGKETAIITDPFDKSTGYSLGRPTADVVTISHSHLAHSFVQGVTVTRKVIQGPGEYEVAGALITGIMTFHDAQGGTERGKNTVYLIEMDGLRLCHLGDLGHIPSSAQVSDLVPLDILLIPVGGVATIDAAAAAEAVRLLGPKVVIPMHYRTPTSSPELDPLDRFLKEMGLREATPEPKLTLSVSPQDNRVVVLDYRH